MKVVSGAFLPSMEERRPRRINHFGGRRISLTLASLSLSPPPPPPLTRSPTDHGGGEGDGGMVGWRERQISGVVKIEQTDSAPWLNSNTTRGSSLENTRIIRARLPGARNMVIVARKPAFARETRRGQQDHATLLEFFRSSMTFFSAFAV